MKAIAIRQPWLWCILHAGKTVENRGWRRSYLGPVLLHSPQAMTAEDYEDCRRFVRRIKGAPRLPPAAELERGGVIGVARITGWLGPERRPADPWRFSGRVGIVLADARPLPFVAAKGNNLGLFDLDVEVAEV